LATAFFVARSTETAFVEQAMKKSTELRKQRDALFVRMKELRDKITNDHPDFSPEEQENWDKLNKDYDACTAGITREERFESLEGDRDRPATPPVPHDTVPVNVRAVATEEQKSLAFQGWMMTQSKRSGVRPTERQIEAATQIGFNLHAGSLDVPLYRSGPNYDSFRRSVLAGTPWQRRDQSTVVDTAGGYLVPDIFINNLERAMLAFGGMRQVADVIRTTGGNDLPWPTTDDTSNTGELVAENASAAEQDVTVGTMILQAYKYSSKVVPVSTELLQDSAFDFAAVLGSLLGERLGRITNTHFTTGTGAARPRGITIASTAGKTTASGTAITSDEILDLIDSVDPDYRNMPGTGFMMHNTVRTYIRKLKDGGGRYLFHPDGNQADAGEPMRLFGFPVTINQAMSSTITSGDITIEFGHLPHYKIRDVASVRFMSSEHRYFEQDQTAFVAFSRHDGDILNAGTNPIKHMVQV